MPIVGQILKLVFGKGKNIFIGIDQMFGLNKAYSLDACLLHRLQHIGIFTLFDLIHFWHLGAAIWKSAEKLGLKGNNENCWNEYKTHLQELGLSFNGYGDILVCNGKVKGEGLLMKDVYENMIKKLSLDPALSPFYVAWHLRIPTKIILFVWFFMEK